MCKNLHYESVYFKELHNQQEYYWLTIYRAGAAVVSAITSLDDEYREKPILFSGALAHEARAAEHQE